MNPHLRDIWVTKVSRDITVKFQTDLSRATSTPFDTPLQEEYNGVKHILISHIHLQIMHKCKPSEKWLLAQNYDDLKNILFDTQRQQTTKANTYGFWGQAVEPLESYSLISLGCA